MIASPGPAPETPGMGRTTPRRSLFWKVAAILVGMQIVIGLLAVALSAYFAYDAALVLVENSVRLRLDGLAEEVELRVPDLSEGLTSVPDPLVNDLSTRFPDPVTIIDERGRTVLVVRPNPTVFSEIDVAEVRSTLPADVPALLETGDVIVNVDGPSFGLAPLYDAAGFLAGGVLVSPLENSIGRELAGTRAALYRAVFVVSLVAGLAALVIGALLTWRIIRPLRSMTGQVERIGQGDYGVRLPHERSDEFGRLSDAINAMAAQVEHSFETLRATDRLRRDLVANIGHDLRTPLTAMRGYVDEARRALSERDAETAIEMLVTASEQTKYITALVEDLFELSLLDSPRPPLRLEPVPLGELAREAATSHQRLINSAGCSFDVTIEEGLPVVQADGVRLLRVLNNLLDNARKHTPKGSRVSLRAAREASEVAISISDSGPGVDPKTLANLFDRYYRGEGPRTREGTGTGLGLAISKAIAEAHGGRLQAHSIIGEGSTFTLFVPILQT